MKHERPNLSRRKLIQALAGASIAAIAGCSPSTSKTPTPDNKSGVLRPAAKPNQAPTSTPEVRPVEYTKVDANNPVYHTNGLILNYDSRFTLFAREEFLDRLIADPQIKMDLPKNFVVVTVIVPQSVKNADPQQLLSSLPRETIKIHLARRFPQNVADDKFNLQPLSLTDAKEISLGFMREKQKQNPNYEEVISLVLAQTWILATREQRAEVYNQTPVPRTELGDLINRISRNLPFRVIENRDPAVNPTLKTY